MGVNKFKVMMFQVFLIEWQRNSILVGIIQKIFKLFRFFVRGLSWLKFGLVGVEWVAYSILLVSAPVCLELL